METNFFSSIADLQLAGDWNINIGKANGQWVVSVLFYNDGIGDDARKIIPPVLLKGTAAELDEGFFNAVSGPFKETAQLFSNMNEYMLQKEQAKVHSQMEKDKKDKAEKEKAERQKKYEEGMKKADELEAEGKHRDAWLKVPDPADYPEYADKLRARKSELAKHFAPDLFNVEPKS